MPLLGKSPIIGRPVVLSCLSAKHEDETPQPFWASKDLGWQESPIQQGRRDAICETINILGPHKLYCHSAAPVFFAVAERRETLTQSWSKAILLGAPVHLRNLELVLGCGLNIILCSFQFWVDRIYLWVTFTVGSYLGYTIEQNDFTWTWLLPSASISLSTYHQTVPSFQPSLAFPQCVAFELFVSTST